MTDAIEQSKAEMRRRMRAILAAMSEDLRRAASRSACQRLIARDEFQRAKTVMLYMPLPGELDVISAAEQALRDGKTVCVPRIDWSKREIEPVRLTSLDDEAMERDQYGVRVPKDSRPIPADGLDLIVVPGLAFDSRGHRLGRSAGFYDRFLATLKPAVIKVGIAFEQQIVENLPTKPHDMAVEAVVTDGRVETVSR